MWMIKGKIIEELFKLYESKIQEYITTEDVISIGDEIISKTDTINNQLSDEHQLLLQEVLELEHDRLLLVEQKSFVYGFILAIKLYTEIEKLVNKI